jgi:hypothetical protein
MTSDKKEICGPTHRTKMRRRLISQSIIIRSPIIRITTIGGEKCKCCGVLLLISSPYPILIIIYAKRSLIRLLLWVRQSSHHVSALRPSSIVSLFRFQHSIPQQHQKQKSMQAPLWCRVKVLSGVRKQKKKLQPTKGKIPKFPPRCVSQV